MGKSNGSESGRNLNLWMLFIAGIAVTLVGMAIIILASALVDDSTSLGAIIFIGPIPIIIGSESNATPLASIAAIVVLAMAVILLAVQKRARIS